MKILVVGDIMLDSYICGTAERMSQEAPVPIFLKDNANTPPSVLGGAGNVAMNLKELQVEVDLCGIIGNDLAGSIIARILRYNNIDDDYLYKDRIRKTTVKTRVLVNN